MQRAMNPGSLVAFVTVCAAGLLSLAIGARARRSDLDALLLALLAAIGVWGAGVGAWSAADFDASWQTLALMTSFVGVFAAMPLWLLFVVRAARPRWLERVRALPLWLAAPYALAYLALLTDSRHHWVLREGVPTTAPIRDFAGPVLIALAVLSVTWLLTASGLLLAWAWRLRHRLDVHRASLVALALAAVVPLAGLGARFFVGATSAHSVFPASFVVAALLLAAGPLRDRLLRGVPLAHRDVFESLRDGVLVANARGEIVDANPAAERLLGSELARLRARDLADVIAELAAPERSSSLRRELDDLASSEAPLRLDVALRDGRRLEVRAACVGEVATDSLGRYALLRDRTAERRFAEAARRAQKLETVATLAGGVAHEVSNPLAFVRANLAEIDRLGAAAEQHLEGGASPLARELVDLRSLAQEALEGIARIERIAAGMRRLSTAGDGFGSVELGPVLDEAVQLARIRFARPLDVALRLDPQLPSVRGAPALLVQALLHLLVAAQRGASADGSAIEVRGERTGDEVVVRIAAAGRAGADARRELVDAEREAGAARSDDPGLPIARDIARDHGGALEVAGPAAAPTELALRLPLAEGV
ncbi:MAG TPA: histidine kinase N-terminal 7TM domain-containing protein [Myxococcota bacterium]|nr:histidine kinase N-terminal 7TM domain-containing protein [Myxococcota bacterium]